MSTKRTTSTPSGTSVGGNGRDLTFGVDPPRRTVQKSQLLVAVLVVGVSALAGVVLFSQAAARDPVLALAVPVERGQVIISGDLRVVYVGTDDPIASIGPDELPSVVGLAAASDMDAGTLITTDLVVGRAALEDGEGVVGLALNPGEYPSPRLASGDLVDVIDTEPGGGVLAGAAEVFDVVELGTQGQRFISLRTSDDIAAAVAEAAADPGRLRLVLVGESG